jgi:hypothetical protein
LAKSHSTDLCLGVDVRYKRTIHEFLNRPNAL